MSTFDIGIVGGGIIGLLTARELANAGASVIVLEAGDCGRESSWAGGGIVSPLYPWRYAEPVTALASAAQMVYPVLCEQLHQRTGIDPEWQRSGLLLLDVADQNEALAWSLQRGRHGQALTGAAIAADQPDLHEHVLQAICFPDVAQVRNPRLMQALRADLLQMGVEIRERTPVSGWLEQRGNQRIVAAQTAAGPVPAGQFVICSGAWSTALLTPLAVELPVQPVRGQMLMFAAHRHRLQRIVLRDGRYLIPRRDGRILCGSTLEHVGFDKRTTEPARESLWQSALTIMPSLREVPIELQWAGLRPGSPRGIPVIGRVPSRDNLWVNAGHFRNGIVLAPASARLLADQLLDRASAIAIEPYQLAS